MQKSKKQQVEIYQAPWTNQGNYLGTAYWHTHNTEGSVT